jgi:hypothetical protein
MRRIYMTLVAFSIVATSMLNSQVVVDCPTGDRCKCESYRDTEGNILTTYKGYGSTTTTTGPQQ